MGREEGGYSQKTYVRRGRRGHVARSNEGRPAIQVWWEMKDARRRYDARIDLLLDPFIARRVGDEYGVTKTLRSPRPVLGVVVVGRDHRFGPVRSYWPGGRE